MSFITPCSVDFLPEAGETLLHPKFSSTLDRALESILTADGCGTVQIVGCTAAGKSHLKRELHKAICDLQHERLKNDPSHIAVAQFTVRLLSKTGFSWTAFCEDYLIALKHPNPACRDLNEARSKMVSAHKSRQPITVLVDEAHHILNGCVDTVMIRNQSEVLKSICEDTNSKMTLIGTYDLVPWLRTNGQAARRNRVFHLERYYNIAEDRKTFREILKNIDECCKASLLIQLSKYEEMIFASCLGLVGLLRNWLVRARQNSVGAGEAGISGDALEATKPSALELIPILRESQEGEKLLTETEQDMETLEMLLREDGVNRSKQRMPQKVMSPKRPRRSKPRRKPIRDRVGP